MNMESIIEVRARDDFHLELLFSTGENGVFDAQPYLQKGVFQRLKDINEFKRAYVAYDTVCWPGGLDIAPETLYDRAEKGN